MKGKCQVLHLGRNNPMNWTVQYREWLDWQERAGGSGGQQVENEPSAWPCNTEGWGYPDLLWECCQQVRGGDLAPLFSVGCVHCVPGVLCPFLGFPVQEIYEHINPVEGQWEQALMWICLTPAPRNEVGWGRIISATLTRLQALHPPEYHKNLTLFWQVPGHFIITHPL